MPDFCAPSAYINESIKNHISYAQYNFFVLVYGRSSSNLFVDQVANMTGYAVRYGCSCATKRPSYKQTLLWVFPFAWCRKYPIRSKINLQCTSAHLHLYAYLSFQLLALSSPSTRQTHHHSVARRNPVRHPRFVLLGREV